jgi:hypothetical protein
MDVTRALGKAQKGPREETMNLREKYKAAARKAFFDGIDAGNEGQLIAWIRGNCGYHDRHEFYLVLGIGCELAKIQSRERGYNDNVHEAYELAKKAVAEKGRL